MMRKNFVASFAFFCTYIVYSGQVFGQGDAYYVNALRFSLAQPYGSARTLGFVGAQTALGADLGSLSSNPAGLGFYRKSEYSISPNFVVPSSTSTVFGTPVSDSKLVFNINNMGVAFCGLRDDLVETKWRGGTFAIGMTRVANFQNSYTYQGDNANNSLADYLVVIANQGYDPSTYNKNNIRGIEDLAWGTYVINPNNNGTFYNLLPSNVRVRQVEAINERGGTNEWTAGYGGNYDNKLFFGGSLSLVSTRYDRSRNFRENLLDSLSATNIMTSLSMDDNLSVRGTGINLTLGVTGVLSDVIRVGASVKTPTYMGLRETYNASMNTTFANIYNQPELPYSASKTATTQKNNYWITTPLKLNGGLAVFLGKAGFVTGEVEYLDYKTMYVGGSNKSNYISTNSNIDQAFSNVVNIKVGAEIRLDMVRLRGGYGVYGSPWNSGIPSFDRRIRSNEMQMLTLGFGVRTSEFFFDLAYGRSTYTSNYSPYLLPFNTPLQAEPRVETTHRINTLTIGAGAFF